VGTPVTAHLDHPGDVDVFQIASPTGRYRVLISGGPDAPFEWRVSDEAEWRHELKATVELEEGSHISLRRSPSESAASKELPGSDAPYTIDLSRAP
jgi:hypothetical protein